MPNHRRQDRELDALYATLPALRCQGLCHDSCGPISVSVRERARMVERARKPLNCGKGAACSMLTAERRCGVYDIRPMICRLWGLVKKLRCPYGCEPERWVSDADAARLLLQAEVIGGTEDRGRLIAELQSALELPEEELARLAGRVLTGAAATTAGRMATLHRTGVTMPFEQRGIPWGDTAMAYRPQEKP